MKFLNLYLILKITTWNGKNYILCFSTSTTSKVKTESPSKLTTTPEISIAKLTSPVGKKQTTKWKDFFQIFHKWWNPVFLKKVFVEKQVNEKRFHWFDGFHNW